MPTVSELQGKTECSPEEQLARFCMAVNDARDLLDFAVREWPAVLSRQNKKVPDLDEGIKRAILHAEDLAAKSILPDETQRSVFEEAYYDLCALLAPISIRTVRATSDQYAREHEGKRYCYARRWARSLWAWTGVFVVLAIGIEVSFLMFFWPPSPETDLPRAYLWYLMYYLRPFIYGGAGACAFLLRSCVRYIGQREFDPSFRPEYFNRILLGVAGGGIVYYLAKGAGVLEVSTGAVKAITPALFGFIAGYFNNRLFQMLERLADAIFPGVTLQVAETVEQKPVPSPISKLRAERLVELLRDTSDPEDKKVITALLEKWARQAS